MKLKPVMRDLEAGFPGHPFAKLFVHHPTNIENTAAVVAPEVIVILM